MRNNTAKGYPDWKGPPPTGGVGLLTGYARIEANGTTEVLGNEPDQLCRGSATTGPGGVWNGKLEVPAGRSISFADDLVCNSCATGYYANDLIASSTACRKCEGASGLCCYCFLSADYVKIISPTSLLPCTLSPDMSDWDIGGTDCTQCVGGGSYSNGILQCASHARTTLLIAMAFFYIFYLGAFTLWYTYNKRRRDEKNAERQKEDRAFLRATMADRKKLQLDEENSASESFGSWIKAQGMHMRNTYTWVVKLLAFASRAIVSYWLMRAVREFCLCYRNVNSLGECVDLVRLDANVLDFILAPILSSSLLRFTAFFANLSSSCVFSP